MNDDDREPLDTARMFSQEFWDARYASADSLWSGNPNQRLVENVAGRRPGTALDLGSGEGADAIWLATHGWSVTAVDVSPIALERATRHAAAADPEIAARMSWQRADLTSWDPPQRHFDLVSEQFLHLPRAIRDVQHRKWAAAVRPGGMLLIVGHHPSDLHTTMRRPNLPELFFTAEEEAAALDRAGWTITVSAPEREAVDPDGRPVIIRDTVLQAIRNRRAERS
jgi:SAM-dependent methyltransferase